MKCVLCKVLRVPDLDKFQAPFLYDASSPSLILGRDVHS